MTMTKSYTIINIGESNCKIDVELTETEVQFLHRLFGKLNASNDGSYAPYITISEIK